MSKPINHALITASNVIPLRLNGNPITNAHNAEAVAQLIGGYIVGPTRRGRPPRETKNNPVFFVLL